jgi:glycosyltransferase involved in cell wall biosynthesis
MDISFIIPSRNNLKYLKQAYHSIRKHWNSQIVLLDDASTDGTWEWLQLIKTRDSNVEIYKNSGEERVGHTVLYDKGVELCSNEVFGIFHADMVMSSTYLNAIKHVKPGKVVSLTRIEPPLHPPGPEKIVKDFGLEPEDFKEVEFEEFAQKSSLENKDKVTNGVFAPWIMYKEDFIKIGGHDKLFAPMELEDSDIFNRMMLAGYEFIQARDAFVYHMTCRGSRFKDGVKITNRIDLGENNIWLTPEDSEEYLALRKIKFREWWRKWKIDVLHNEDLLPIVPKRYSTAFIITNCDLELIELLEPFADEMWIDCPYEQYLATEQPKTLFNLSKKFYQLGSGLPTTDVTILFDGTSFAPRHYPDFIKNLPFVIEQTNQIGVFNWDRFIIRVENLKGRDMILPWFKNIF